MPKFNPSIYRTIATGAAGATLTTSSLDAVVQTIDFGPSGLEAGQIGATSTGGGGTGMKSFFGIGFDRSGNFANSAGLGTSNFSLALAFKRWDNLLGGSTNLQKLDGTFAKIKGSFNTAGSGPSRPLANIISSPLTENARVGPSQSFNGSFVQGRIFPTASPTAATNAPSAPLLSGDRGIVGFAAPLSDTDTIFGWADIFVSEVEFRVFEIRFETEPNTALVPEVKHSALLLALGAGGMAALRRRRRKTA